MAPQYHYCKGIAYSTAAAVMWAILPIFLKMALRQSDTITIVWFRFLFAMILLLILGIFKNRHWFKILKKPPLLLWGASLMLAFNYFGYMMGVNYTSPSVSQVVIQFGPLLMAVGGTFYFKEKLQVLQWLGFVAFVMGFGIFYSDQARSLFQGNFSLGVVWILVAAVAWAFYALFQKVLVAKYPPQSLNIFIFMLSTLIYTPFVSFSELQHYSAFTWGVLIFCGFNTFIAYGAVAEAIKCMPAAIVSVIICLNPLLTMVVMRWYNAHLVDSSPVDLREQIGTVGIWGAIFLILGAVTIIAGPKIKSEALRLRLKK